MISGPNGVHDSFTALRVVEFRTAYIGDTSIPRGVEGIILAIL